MAISRGRVIQQNPLMESLKQLGTSMKQMMDVYQTQQEIDRLREKQRGDMWWQVAKNDMLQHPGGSTGWASENKENLAWGLSTYGGMDPDTAKRSATAMSTTTMSPEQIAAMTFSRFTELTGEYGPDWIQRYGQQQAEETETETGIPSGAPVQQQPLATDRGSEDSQTPTEKTKPTQREVIGTEGFSSHEDVDLSYRKKTGVIPARPAEIHKTLKESSIYPAILNVVRGTDIPASTIRKYYDSGGKWESLSPEEVNDMRRVYQGYEQFGRRIGDILLKTNAYVGTPEERRAIGEQMAELLTRQEAYGTEVGLPDSMDRPYYIWETAGEAGQVTAKVDPKQGLGIATERNGGLTSNKPSAQAAKRLLKEVEVLGKIPPEDQQKEIKRQPKKYANLLKGSTNWLTEDIKIRDRFTPERVANLYSYFNNTDDRLTKSVIPQAIQLEQRGEALDIDRMRAELDREEFEHMKRLQAAQVELQGALAQVPKPAKELIDFSRDYLTSVLKENPSILNNKTQFNKALDADPVFKATVDTMLQILSSVTGGQVTSEKADPGLLSKLFGVSTTGLAYTSGPERLSGALDQAVEQAAQRGMSRETQSLYRELMEE